VSPDEAVLKAALRLLSTRARTVKELRGRLLKKGLKSSEVSRCLRWLEERDLLNDEAFARSFLFDRIRFSPRSPFLLERELRNRGVDPSLAGTMVKRVLEEEATSERDLSVQAAEGWVRKQSPTVRKDLLGERFSPEREKARRRLYGFLARRGFVGEAARQGLEAGMEKARELGG
jgi:regulatory protein